jgi:hypothetical protein
MTASRRRRCARADILMAHGPIVPTSPPCVLARNRPAKRDTGWMPVSEADRRKMASMARSLTLAETDEEPSDSRKGEIIAWANARRARQGIGPLAEDEQTEPPEEEFYRRARVLGMVSSRHRCS